ncbi:MAG: AmmeMemoRadiSam system protein A [Deltaproteobacteria bacterium]|nr:AmmeMemoRadiSam system protein A [Deltaproteobacteria bacterium]
MPLTRAEKKTLLELARASLEAAVKGAQSPDPDFGASSPLGRTGGAFVTFHIGEDLRGCIGMIMSDKPVYQTVMDMAAAAAMHDTRFVPITPAELGAIDIEISLLTPLRQVTSIDEIEPGRHGLYIIKGRRSGLLLPQVALECDFDTEEFLDQTCMKAGLRPGCWRDGQAAIFIFEAEIINEE